MPVPFTGEVKMFAGSFAPRGWRYCDGQLLAISQYQALYALIGTTYGGDGRSTFGIPDMRGRVPVHQGQGLSLTKRILGERAGVEKVTLTMNDMPSHTHLIQATSDAATTADPTNAVPAQTPDTFYSNSSTTDATLYGGTVLENSGGDSHYNIQPSLCIGFVICLEGEFPNRN